MGSRRERLGILNRRLGEVWRLNRIVNDQAHIGGIYVDYPDLVLSALLGGFVAGQRGQWQAAALVTVLTAASLLLMPVNTMFPATLPAAVTLIALVFPLVPTGEVHNVWLFELKVAAGTLAVVGCEAAAKNLRNKLWLLSKQRKRREGQSYVGG